MIVAFAVDPEALALAEPPDPTRLQAHNRLIQRWERLGVLVYAGQRPAESELSVAVAKLPVKARKLWQEALLSRRTRRGPVGWQGLQATESIEDLDPLGNAVQVACF